MVLQNQNPGTGAMSDPNTPSTFLVGRRMPSQIAAPPAGTDRKAGDRVRAAYVRTRRRFIQSLKQNESNYGEMEMPRWDGGYASDGRHYKPIWPKIAAKLEQRGCTNIERFVAVQFDGDAPTPNMLLSDDAWEKYLQLDSVVEARIRKQFSVETDVFRSRFLEVGEWYPQLSDRECWLRVLVERHNGLSPLFRYCVAVAEGMPEVADAYHEGALLQLLSDPDGYRQHWGPALPEKIVHEAELALLNERS